jgi:hypothetical protein
LVWLGHMRMPDQGAAMRLARTSHGSVGSTDGEGLSKARR